MTGERRRIVLAAVLWAVLALILWNVIFDYGVRTAATGYLVARTAYLHGRGPRD
jgi:high-affinity Fe2+/Pb2+ permease